MPTYPGWITREEATAVVRQAASASQVRKHRLEADADRLLGARGLGEVPAGGATRRPGAPVRVERFQRLETPSSCAAGAGLQLAASSPN